MVAASETLLMLPGDKDREALLVVGEMAPAKVVTEVSVLLGLVEEASPWTGELGED